MSPDTRILLQDEDGNQYTSNQTYHKLLERIDHLELTTNKLWEEYYNSQEHILKLEEPSRLADIIGRFHDEQKPHKSMWFQYRHVRHDDLLKLVEQGKAEEIKHPCGKFMMYRIKVKA